MVITIASVFIKNLFLFKTKSSDFECIREKFESQGLLISGLRFTSFLDKRTSDQIFLEINRYLFLNL